MTNRDPRAFLRQVLRRLLPLTVSLGLLALGLYQLVGEESGGGRNAKVLRVLSYSSFVNSWGPGAEVAERFEKEYGLKVEFEEVSDAGLLLKRLELASADVVLGFDQLGLEQARSARPWRKVFAELPGVQELEIAPSHRHDDFLAFDWAPLAFVYRRGEIEPPKGFGDLLDVRFKGAIALQDPRTSSPGLQLLLWILDELGVEEGFSYLEKLKPNLQSVSPSWSAAYGLFTSRQARLAFSYLTSPVYHWTAEKDPSYQAAVFASGHVAQVEYAGVPESCNDCVGGRLFALYLLRPEIQRIIMEKNVMLPVVRGVRDGTKFAKLPTVTVRDFKSLPALLERREAILERWRALGL